MSSDAALIHLDGVTKTFRIQQPARRRAGWQAWRPAPYEVFTAVDNATLGVARGEVVGLVGANGAGKSTLLKLLSRVMHPDRGRITLGGRVMSLLEVGAGFHPELTARENVFLNGAILGLDARAVRRTFDDIIGLAGVEQFLDTPVKRFSSGMKVRLAIAVGLHLDCEAVVLDEVLSVGDADFQSRCLSILDRMVSEEGRAALLVSHNMQTIRQACDRVIVLEHGRVAFDGDPSHAIEVYFRQVASTATEAVLTGRTNPHGNNRLHLLALRLIDDRGEDLSPVTEGPLGFEVTLDLDAVDGPVNVSVRLKTRTSPLIAAVEHTFQQVSGGGVVRSTWLTERTPLSAGQYSASVVLTDSEGTTIDAVEDALSFTVTDPAETPGSLSAGLKAGHIRLDGDWSLRDAR